MPLCLNSSWQISVKLILILLFWYVLCAGCVFARIYDFNCAILGLSSSFLFHLVLNLVLLIVCLWPAIINIFHCSAAVHTASHFTVSLLLGLRWMICIAGAEQRFEIYQRLFLWLSVIYGRKKCLINSSCFSRFVVLIF